MFSIRTARAKRLSAHGSRLRAYLGIGVIAATGLVVAPIAASSGASASDSGSGGTLIVGMTAGAIPPLDTILAEAQGNEGLRFVGFQLYDGLTGWDLTSKTLDPTAIPDLATSWTSNASATVWTFTLRHGVKFQDGTPFNAAAVIFNFNRYFDSSFKYFDAAINASSAVILGAPPASYTALGAYKIQLTLKSPISYLPELMTELYMASPTAVMKEGNTGFGLKPVGTGPFKFSSETPEQLVLKPNKSYWAGAPKLSELILKPIPSATARIAALRTGAVNWIEYPTPDDISQLQGEGFQIFTNSYDHIWPWIFDTSVAPWNNVLVRQAANYAINRQAMVTDVLHGTADAAYQVVPRANPAYSSKSFKYSYDPKKAKALLKQAGYPNGFTATMSYPTSGSGNMIPGPMNEELQQNLAAVGIKITLEPMQWATMITQAESGKEPDGASSTNISLTFSPESTWSEFFGSTGFFNLSHWSNPVVDKDLAQAQETLNASARNHLYSEAANIITQDAPWLFVVNDRNPRALAPTVHGFIEPKSWFVNLRTVWVS